MSRVISFEVQNSELHEIAMAIRTKVFVEEQGVPADLELEHEEDSIHFLLYYRRKPIGTARFRETENGVKLERFAILKEFRKIGLGNDLIRFVLTKAREIKRPIYLNAQIQVVDYYAKWGFIKEGEAFFEAGIQHFKMVYHSSDLVNKALPKAICRR
ncbi:MAG: GNAT family N-acetyltransferase [Bacteroidales bacterium]|nr:GNAT family N-acetyltransferase [Bacteroidales bacterium]